VHKEKKIMRKIVLVGGLSTALVAGQLLLAAAPSKSAPAPTSLSATMDCDEDSAPIVTLLQLAPTQRLVLTDYVVRNRDNRVNGITFGSDAGPIRKFSIAVPGEGYLHGSFSTPIVFDGADGNVGISCRFWSEVSVSGLLE
jgi:hypothetical protein